MKQRLLERRAFSSVYILHNIAFACEYSEKNIPGEMKANIILILF